MKTFPNRPIAGLVAALGFVVSGAVFAADAGSQVASAAPQPVTHDVVRQEAPVVLEPLKVVGKAHGTHPTPVQVRYQSTVCAFSPDAPTCN